MIEDLHGLEFAFHDDAANSAASFTRHVESLASLDSRLLFVRIREERATERDLQLVRSQLLRGKQIVWLLTSKSSFETLAMLGCHEVRHCLVKPQETCIVLETLADSLRAEDLFHICFRHDDAGPIAKSWDGMVLYALALRAYNGLPELLLPHEGPLTAPFIQSIDQAISTLSDAQVAWSPKKRLTRLVAASVASAACILAVSVVLWKVQMIEYSALNENWMEVDSWPPYVPLGDLAARAEAVLQRGPLDKLNELSTSDELFHVLTAFRRFDLLNSEWKLIAPVLAIDSQTHVELVSDYLSTLQQDTRESIQLGQFNHAMRLATRSAAVLRAATRPEIAALSSAAQEVSWRVRSFVSTNFLLDDLTRLRVIGICLSMPMHGYFNWAWNEGDDSCTDESGLMGLGPIDQSLQEEYEYARIRVGTVGCDGNTVNQWARFLDKYPASGLAAAAAFNLLNCEMDTLAREPLTAFSRRAEFVGKAMKFEVRFKNHSLADDALWYAARIAWDGRDFQALRAAIQILLNRYGDRDSTKRLMLSPDQAEGSMTQRINCLQSTTTLSLHSSYDALKQVVDANCDAASRTLLEGVRMESAEPAGPFIAQLTRFSLSPPNWPRP